MKKIILYMIMAIAGMIAVSCDKVIDEFDNSTNYIYFDMPFILVSIREKDNCSRG